MRGGYRYPGDGEPTATTTGCQPTTKSRSASSLLTKAISFATGQSVTGLALTPIAAGRQVTVTVYGAAVDVVADLVMTAVLIVLMAIGKYGEKQRIGVHVDSVLWYFLVAIWIPLYAVLYWGPHFVGASR